MKTITDFNPFIPFEPSKKLEKEMEALISVHRKRQGSHPRVNTPSKYLPLEPLKMYFYKKKYRSLKGRETLIHFYINHKFKYTFLYYHK